MAADRGARLWRRLWRRPPAVVGALVVLFFVALAVGAPWIATSDPQRSDYGKIRKAPTTANPFGTDDLGRDNFSRVVWGTRISMQAGVFSILLAIAIGVPAGLVAGYWSGGVIDQLIMRLTDAWLAFPFLILAIGLVTISALLVQATVSIPAAIIAEAILSFLGLGVQPPTPRWGTMLNTAQQFLETAPWMAWWPGLAIFSLTLSFNLAGDGLRDLLDPKDY